MMRTLYARIILVTMAIMIVSASLSFIAANLYYHFNLKSKNDEKITAMARNIVNIYEAGNGQNLGGYLSELTALGYQFHVVDQQMQEKQYGLPFRSYSLPDRDIEQVLAGGTYHGIAAYPWQLAVTGFFDNELRNTVGVPVHTDGKTAALFVRPNANKQFGEMRIFLALMLVLMLVLSFLFVLFSTRFIVLPLKQLAGATKRIAAGNYHIQLKTNRRDELGRLAGDFSTMAQDLSRLEEKRQEFVSNVSHEFQTPLTSIKGFSQALREEGLPEDLRRHYLEIIENETTRLSSLSKQLLTLSFLDSGSSRDEWTTCDLAKQLEEVVTATAWQWQEKTLGVELDLEPLTVFGDPKLLQLVWSNLVTNAIRYTPTGGNVRIRARALKHDAEITVEDNGIGIDEKDLTHLFERFYKADTARTRSENSTGLGLSIVKRIVELHGGSIVAESEPGKGSRFICRIPRM